MEYKRLSEIANIVSGYAIPSDCMADVGTPILKITNIKEDNTLDLENTAKYTLPIGDKLNKFLLRDKDILVCMTGATIGKVARKVKVEGKYIVNQRVAIVRPKNPKDFDFVYYILKEPTFRRYVELVGYGAAQPNISASAIGKFCFACDEKLNRKSIGEILSSYDNLIEANSRRIKILEQMAENLYKEWFVRFRFPNYQNTPIENGIPKGWKVEKLKEIINLYDSKRIPLSSLERDQQHKIYPYYGAAEIMDYVEDYIFDGRYLLMGEDGSVITPEGFPILQLASGKFWVNNHAHVMQGKDGFSIEYLYLLFKKMNITGIVTGSAQPKISQGRLINKNVLVPAKELRRIFDKQVAPIFSQINTLQLQSANLTRQRNLLLPRLMSGQLTPLTNQ